MQYQPLNLELSDYRKEGETESFRLRVTTPLRTEQSSGDARQVTFGSDLRTRLRLLELRRLDEPGLIELGEMLGRLLFPDELSSHLYDCLNHVGNDNGLRIQIKTGSFALANIPWEYAYVKPPDDSAVGG